MWYLKAICLFLEIKLSMRKFFNHKNTLSIKCRKNVKKWWWWKFFLESFSHFHVQTTVIWIRWKMRFFRFFAITYKMKHNNVDSKLPTMTNHIDVNHKILLSMRSNLLFSSRNPNVNRKTTTTFSHSFSTDGFVHEN